MDEIQSMEKHLAELKERKAWDKFVSDYNDAKDKYEGKCLSTHLLAKPLANYRMRNNETYFRVRYIKKIYMGELYYSGVEPKVITTLDEWKKWNACNDIKVVALGEELSVRKSSDGQFHVDFSEFRDDIYYMEVSDLRCELTKDVYDGLKTLLSQMSDNFLAVATNKLSFKPYVDKTQIETLERNGAKLIDLNFSEVYMLMDNPFRYGDKMVVNDVSIAIIKEELQVEKELALLDTGSYSCGEYISLSGFHTRKVGLLNDILTKMNSVVM